jgi:opacity protein-like surface antigen
MIKRAILVFSLFFAIAILHAQDSTKYYVPPASTGTVSPKFRMGLSLSPLLAWYNPSGEPNFADGDGSRFTISYGLHLDFRVGTNANYYFSTGLFLLNTGGKITHNEVDTVSTYKHRINYVNIPLTMMLRTNEVGYMTYFARVGFDSGFAVKSNFDLTESTASGSVTRDQVDDPDLANLFRFGLHLEGGVEYNLAGNTNLALSIEWNNGLSNVFNDDYKITTSEGTKRVKATDNLIMLNIGVYF